MRSTTTIRMDRLLGIILLAVPLTVLTLLPCGAADWPPTDPKEYTTEVDFTLAWAKRLKGFRTLEQLQRAAKAKGTISDQHLDGDNPQVTFHWRSEPPRRDNVGYMLANVSRDGSIGVDILTTDNHEVIINTEGFFEQTR
jgi:hypothetical protein